MKSKKITLFLLFSMLIVVNKSIAQTDQFIQNDPIQENTLINETLATDADFKELTVGDFSKSIWNRIVAGIKYSFFTIKQATSDILSIEPAPTPEPGVISAVKKASNLAPNTNANSNTNLDSIPNNQNQIINTRRNGSSGSGSITSPKPNANTTTTATPTPSSTVKPRQSTTISPSPSPTQSPSPTSTPTPSTTSTPSPTATATHTPTPTSTPTPTLTPTPTPTTSTPSPTNTPSTSPTPSPTPSNSPRASYVQPIANLYDISKVLFEVLIKINDQNYPILHKK